MNSKKDLVGSKKVQKIVRIGQDPRVTKMQEESKTEELIKKQIWKLEADITIFYSMIQNFSIACGQQCECEWTDKIKIINSLITYRYLQANGYLGEI